MNSISDPKRSLQLNANRRVGGCETSVDTEPKRNLSLSTPRRRRRADTSLPVLVYCILTSYDVSFLASKPLALCQTSPPPPYHSLNCRRRPIDSRLNTQIEHRLTSRLRWSRLVVDNTTDLSPNTSGQFSPHVPVMSVKGWLASELRRPHSPQDNQHSGLWCHVSWSSHKSRKSRSRPLSLSYAGLYICLFSILTSFPAMTESHSKSCLPSFNPGWVTGRMKEKLAHPDWGVGPPGGVPHHPRSPSSLADSGSPGRAPTELRADFCLLDRPRSSISNLAPFLRYLGLDC